MQCANEEAKPQREVDTRRCASKDTGLEGGGLGVPHRLEKGPSSARTLGPEGGWIGRSHIGWRGERNILYKGVEISS